RVTYVGAKTRRALLRWGGGQRSSAIFPLTASGGTTLMARLSRKSGVHITFHKCRRTFATWINRLWGHFIAQSTTIVPLKWSPTGSGNE
ncbi:MAG: hypothetical protein ACC700_19725, partial [Anaerolineales bacterium]